jgi:hypothetical protein
VRGKVQEVCHAAWGFSGLVGDGVECGKEENILMTGRRKKKIMTEGILGIKF